MFPPSYKIPTRDCTLWYALSGGLLGGSLGFSLLLFWHEAMPLRSAHFGFFDLMWALVTGPLTLFGAFWGAIHGVFLALEEQCKAQPLSQDAQFVGLTSFIVLLGATICATNLMFVGHAHELRRYFLFTCCLCFSGLGLSLARRWRLRLLFLIPNLWALYYVVRSYYFPWQLLPRTIS